MKNLIFITVFNIFVNIYLINLFCFNYLFKLNKLWNCDLMLYYVLYRIITNMAHSEAGKWTPDPHSQVFSVLQTL